MKCPFCFSSNSKVSDSRSINDSLIVKRRRECLSCGKRWTTHEKVEKDVVMVVKTDGRREPFDVKKMERGVQRACIKRSIAAETMSKIVSGVESEIMNEYVLEVPSAVIGEKILQQLWNIDLVAYIRFASVYKKFDSIDAFMKELKKLNKKNSKTSHGKIFNVKNNK